jgi:hypothetical protein
MSAPAAPTPGTTSPGSTYGSQMNQKYYESKPYLFWPFYAQRPDNGGPNGTSRTDRWAGLTPLTPEQTWALFAALIAQGYILDEEVEGGVDIDPYTTHFIRQNSYGQTWEPAGTGDVQVTSINQPGAVVTPGEFSGPVTSAGLPNQSWVVTAANGTIGIRVSILFLDYPPTTLPSAPASPAPAPVQPIANPVGPLKVPSAINAVTQVGGLFQTLVNAQGLDGYVMSALWPATGTGEAQGLTGQWQKIPGFVGMGAYWEKIA